MKGLGMYLTSFNRYRRSKGFGVHSPFAYNFIVNVLRERLHYYSYNRIDGVAREDGSISVQDARRLFRTVNYFNPSRVIITADCSPAAVKAIREVSHHIEIYNFNEMVTGLEGEMLVVDKCDCKCLHKFEKVACRILSEGGTVVIYGMSSRPVNRSLFKSVNCCMEWGMTFTNGNMAVMTGRKDLPRQRFNLWF